LAEKPPAPVPAPKIEGYQATTLLGRGGHGSVYAGVRQSDGMRVAIKVSRADQPGAGAHLRRELRFLEQVAPPHVPAVLESGGLAAGSTYAVLEHVDWPTLAAGLTASGAPLPAEAFARQAGAILTSLGATHAKGVVHADLKPENIFLQALPARAR